MPPDRLCPRAFTAGAHCARRVWVLLMAGSSSGSGRPPTPQRPCSARSDAPGYRTPWPAVGYQDGLVSRPEPGPSLVEAWRQSGLTVFELWLVYFAMGGDAPGLEIEAYRYGGLHPTAASTTSSPRP
jgi:hypothetical protein